MLKIFELRQFLHATQSSSNGLVCSTVVADVFNGVVTHVCALSFFSCETDERRRHRRDRRDRRDRRVGETDERHTSVDQQLPAAFPDLPDLCLHHHLSSRYRGTWGEVMPSSMRPLDAASSVDSLKSCRRTQACETVAVHVARVAQHCNHLKH